ncbi:hypothetical protein LCGC14_0694150 [marine sediment metagenome]|uniref:Lipoprotein n=1 Tax=marine sediment metagenome TaxID=412755 RepID=A0A0F9TSH0_9ZZZZ
MNMKKIMGLILVGLIVLVGCQNRSAEICSFVEASKTDKNTTTRMEGVVCVIEDKDYETVLVLKCSSFLGFTEINLVLKYNNETNLTSINEIKNKCDIIGEERVTS